MRLSAIAGVFGVGALAVTGIPAGPINDGKPLVAFRSQREIERYLKEILDRQDRKPSCNGQVKVRVRRRLGDALTRPEAVVAGTVRQVGGGPVRARVSVEATAVATDSAGRFNLITRPSVGRTVVPLRVVALGFERTIKQITVSPGDSLTVSLQVCPVVYHLAEVVTSASAVATLSMSITNVQHQGIDEGGIVKRAGDHLIILRRGRLYSVDIGDGRLESRASVAAAGPHLDSKGTWYDELLVWGDRVVVIGYSYRRSGTELGLFRLGPNGALTHEATYQLRSGDYYSSRNYASRLVGDTLVFYSPIVIAGDDPAALLPALGRIDADTALPTMQLLVVPNRVYRSSRALEPRDYPTIHAITTCTLRRPGLSCEATAVVGPAARVTYASPTATYLWISPWRPPVAPEPASIVYRLPRDGQAPGALAVAGVPIDQFSFLEADGHLNVLVTPDGRGETMWAAERPRHGLALMRTPLASFSRGGGSKARSTYRPLPGAEHEAIVNRFVGRHLLYGAVSDPISVDITRALLTVVDPTGEVTQLGLSHGIDRIEAMGADAVVIGSRGADLSMSGIALTGPPSVRQRLTLANSMQGETRSHGFFYRADGPGSGVMGLPLREPASYRHESYFAASASMRLILNREGDFRDLGGLVSQLSLSGKAAAEGCDASCIDWYGNSRPLFLDGRIIALLGGELVEGRINNGLVVETARVAFAAPAAQGAK